MNTGKFSKEITAGALVRKGVRAKIERSSKDLENSFPGSEVIVKEIKGFLSSLFLIDGYKFPETREALKAIKEWELKLL